MEIIAQTLAVRMNEPCAELREVNLKTPDQKSFHRYQIIKVVRDDKLVEFTHDLGDAREHTADQFRIPGGFVDEAGKGHIFHNVAELVDGAEYLRNRTPDEMPFVLPDKPMIDFENAYHDEADRRRRLASGRKTYGPKGRRT